MSSRATIPECLPLGDRLSHPLPWASGDIMRQGFRATEGLITMEAICDIIMYKEVISVAYEKIYTMGDIQHIHV